MSPLITSVMSDPAAEPTVEATAAAVPAPAADTEETTCCIVGGGPAGMMLALLLSRKGVPVILIEAHGDFDRDFRGDTVHPSTMEIMDQLGLADRLLALPHGKISVLTLNAGGETMPLAHLSRLHSRFPYITLLPQVEFLNFLAAELQKYPQFRLIMGAHACDLVRSSGAVQGVRYRTHDGIHEIRATLTVGADGRFSEIRRIIGEEVKGAAPPMDVLWFRLSRRTTDAVEAAQFRTGPGAMLILLDRREYWQLGYIIPKGGFAHLREEGIAELRRRLGTLAPEFVERLDELHDWKEMAVLSVESGRVRKWYRPGLLLIGDAAHVMSPVFGVGINYAIQDAVVSANILASSLKSGQIQNSLLERVQRSREWPVVVMQALQGVVQRRVIRAALASGKPFTIPPLVRLLLRIPFVQKFAARMIGYGLTRVRVK
ncbi:MAG TPA: FAD-dependent oxidoreductase [Armatimonadota bacterium]|nr:FAD-dependent oxidoreductase [Armatimonadota bacterium]